MKKILVIALVLMLALSMVACNNQKDPSNNPEGGLITLDPNGTGNTPGDDPSSPTDEGTTEDLSTPSKEEFVECDKTVFVITDVANLRSDTYVSESTWVAYASKDAEFKCIGYNSSWYKVEYVTEVEGQPQTQTCYLHRSTAFTKDTSEVALEEPLTLYVIAFALNVRAYYDFEAENNVMCTLKQGDEVKAIAKGDGWYKIQLSNDAEGNEVFGFISSKDTYVSTTKPEDTTAEDTTAAEETTAAEQ